MENVRNVFRIIILLTIKCPVKFLSKTAKHTSMEENAEYVRQTIEFPTTD